MDMNIINEQGSDWELLKESFPSNWKEIAEKSLSRAMRSFEAVEHLIRALLIHIICGKSLIETAAICKLQGYGQISSVGLHKRLIGFGDFFRVLAMEMFKSEITSDMNSNGYNMRLIDGTSVAETGKFGTLYRVLYSFNYKDFCADFYDVTTAKGLGNGECFNRIPVNPKDCLIGDRGFCRFTGIQHIVEHDGFYIVRYCHTNVNLYKEGQPLELAKYLRHLLKKQGDYIDTELNVCGANKELQLPVRLCAIRKTREQYERDVRKLKKRVQKEHRQLSKSTLQLQRYVIVLTSLPKDDFSAEEILEWYRMRWQVELAFKRMKSLMKLCSIPKKSTKSSIAWLYGKLFGGLLVDQIRKKQLDAAFSPWGYCPKYSHAKCLA